MKVTIVRSQWLRGGSATSGSYLVGMGQKMCCLGFLGQACGIDPQDMLFVTSPAYMPPGHQDKWPQGALEEPRSALSGTPSGLSNSDIIHQAMKHNDNGRISDEEREPLIIADLALLGVETVFED